MHRRACVIRATDIHEAKVEIGMQVLRKILVRHGRGPAELAGDVEVAEANLSASLDGAEARALVAVTRDFCDGMDCRVQGDSSKRLIRPR